MSRFFVIPEQIDQNNIRIIDEDAKHISTVLRLKNNDKIIICDGQGTDYKCIIKNVSKNEILAEVETYDKVQTEPNVKIVLFQSLPKLDKMDWIVQKSVELGIHEIIPVITERTIVKVDDAKKGSQKIARWNKISEAAAKQSNRGIIPKVSDIISYKEAIHRCTMLDTAIIPYEKEESHSFRSVLSGFSGSSVGICIGSEGGYTAEEVLYAVQNDIHCITLGKRILRTETAGLMALSIIMYEMGEV